MSPLAAALLGVASEVFKKRLATKSTVEGAVVGGAVATAAGAIDPSSLEGQVLICLTALISIYRILKKEDKK